MGYKMGKLGNWKSGQDLKSEQKKKKQKQNEARAILNRGKMISNQGRN